MDEQMRTMDGFEDNKAGDAAPETSGGVVFALNYMGEFRTVGRDEAIALAQKGMDYDRIRSRYERLKTMSDAPGADPEAIRRSADIDAFLDEFPDVDPKDIPAEVWRQVQAGRPLALAYGSWEARRLREALEAERQREVAGARSTGSRSSTGPGDESDAFIRYFSL